jgi:release factor glutamine methyltransferase
LDGGQDGLFILTEIIRQADRYLKNGGWLALEIGAGQSAEIHKRISQLGKFEAAEIIKDYNGIDRVVMVKKRR